jgi:hypothetical protein
MNKVDVLRILKQKKEFYKKDGVSIDFVSLNSSNKNFIEHIKKELIYV